MPKDKKPEVKRDARFDERRKELHVHTTEERDLKEGDSVLGTATFETKATYNEEGIRRLYKNARQDRTNVEQAIKRCKEMSGKEPTDVELKQLFDHNEKQKRLREVGEYEKNKVELAAHEEKLKEVSQAIHEIKSAVKTRLKGF